MPNLHPKVWLPKLVLLATPVVIKWISYLTVYGLLLHYKE